jgi:L-threonylcarbamoyladenylate synthase
MTGRICDLVRIAGPDDVARAARRAADVLKDGGVILYPTDTIYGLGCLAGDRGAVRRLYHIKGRPESKPSLVLVDSPEMAGDVVAEIPPAARTLMDSCWPGPLTLVLRAAPGVPEALTGGSGKIGVRLPADEFCVRMVRQAGAAVVSTSANRSGVEPAGRFDLLFAQFGGVVDLAVDGGGREGKPSTIADLSDGTLVILREGAFSAAELTRALSGKP